MCSLFTLWAFGKRHLMLKPDRLWILKTGNQQPANYLNIEHFLQSTPSSWFRPMAQLSQGPKQICDTITVGRKSGVVLSSSEFYNPVRYQIHYTDLYNLKWKNNDHIIGIIPYFIKTKSYMLLTPTWGASFMNRLDLLYTNPPRPPSATSALLPPSRSNAEVNSTKRSMDWQIQWGFPGMGVPQ